MKRRVELARALIHDSSILFLDEPTVGLDAQSRERFWLYIDRLRAQRDLTVLVTTHYIEEVEACDRVCVIDRGAILAMDTPTALKVAHGQQLRVAARRQLDRDHGGLSRRDIQGRRRYYPPLQRRFAETFLARYAAAFAGSVEEPSPKAFPAAHGRRSATRPLAPVSAPSRSVARVESTRDERCDGGAASAGRPLRDLALR
jgi:ABC-2 type transport system ATP-binding protein